MKLNWDLKLLAKGEFRSFTPRKKSLGHSHSDDLQENFLGFEQDSSWAHTPILFVEVETKQICPCAILLELFPLSEEYPVQAEKSKA